jgi:segregation and condensation protein B
MERRSAFLSLAAPGPSGSAVPAERWVRDERLARLEAVLFMAREPLNSRKLAQFAHLADGTEARTLIRRLNRWYDESGTAFRAEELAGGFQLLSRPKFGAWLRRLYAGPAEVRLSAPALETLAVVAYRQPVVRAEVEAIRGVDCGEILRQLMDRDLVRTAGRGDELGRPYLYATTKRFLQVFGLRHLDDLPRSDVLRASKSQPKPGGELSPDETALPPSGF